MLRGVAQYSSLHNIHLVAQSRSTETPTKFGAFQITSMPLSYILFVTFWCLQIAPLGDASTLATVLDDPTLNVTVLLPDETILTQLSALLTSPDTAVTPDLVQVRQTPCQPPFPLPPQTTPQASHPNQR